MWQARTLESSIPDLSIQTQHKLLFFFSQTRLDEDDQGVVDSIVTNDYLVVDDDVYFPCVGVDSSCVQFSVLDSYELNSGS